MEKLHIDIETYCPLDLRKVGVYKYVEHPEFEILLIAYAIDDNPIEIIDLTTDSFIELQHFYDLLVSETPTYAHNASFERLSLTMKGFYSDPKIWRCSMLKAAYCGLPLGLDGVSRAMGLEEKGKLTTGKALIRYFCQPCKPTKINGGRTRNLPEHNPEKWEEFKAYCIQDVEAEREIVKRLDCYELPETERRLYLLDQQINDIGIEIDLDLAKNAVEIDEKRSAIIKERMIELTGLNNPNSPAQLKVWLSNAMYENITTLAKDEIPKLIDMTDSGVVKEVLELRQKAAKTSIKKYQAMLNCACADGRAHGLFQFYGANRTGRWAGRLIQLQNLPRNYIKDLDLARGIVVDNDGDLLAMLYESTPSILSQLIRTAFVAPKGHVFAVADFAAIEARVIAWLAGEEWRMEIFRSHGKIYEASASMMFNIPIEEITKGSDYRQKGKIAELALGYQGSLGALTQMGGAEMGLSESEMRMIVAKWRASNPNIVKLWRVVESLAKRALKNIGGRYGFDDLPLRFNYDGLYLTIELPSGRKLFYREPCFTEGKFGNRSIKYKGMDQTTKQWGWVPTYGGKLTENIIQAIARDLLAHSMLELDAVGFRRIVMHVHDEIICESPQCSGAATLEAMCDIMSRSPKWAKDLPLKADGYVTNYYKKD